MRAVTDIGSVEGSGVPLSPSEHTMETGDGAQLFYRSWLPEKPNGRGLVIFHRGHEHSGRLLELVRDLKLDGFSVFAWDARGNGRSSGRRDWAENFSVYVKDADSFVRHVCETHGLQIENMAVMANSVGGVIATAWVHDFAPPIRALVLATPAFRIRLYVPLAIPLLRVADRLNLMPNVTSYVKAKVLTHDREEQERFNTDPEITSSIATNVLVDCFDTAQRLIKDAGAIRVPLMLQAAGSDWVTEVGAQREFFDGLSSQRKEWRFYPDFYHAIYHETGREAPIAAARDFILDVFETEEQLPSLQRADRCGFTKDEFDELTMPVFSPVFSATKFSMNTVGRISHGIRCGLESGFDSGVALDYVYENEPRGSGPIGRLVDKAYLESIGWKGIRQRRLHIVELLHSAIEKLGAGGTKPVHIVDVAAGPGRYVLDAVATSAGQVTATLRDYQQVNIDAGRELARKLGVQGVRYELGDAFDTEQLANLDPCPNLGIVSGLFELFAANDPVQASLKGLAAAIPEGGYLLYTNQPWHPQVEFIARVLGNREGEPWIMRRRTQEEMDELVSRAGFRKETMLIDRWGVFSVSLARRG